MDLATIVAASDESEEGRRAAFLGADLASRAEARLVVLRVVSPPPAMRSEPEVGDDQGPALQQLERWIGPSLADRWPALVTEYAIRPGLPRVEIARFAVERGADVVVLGRKPRTQRNRLLLGDTADSVVRRSELPCLLTPVIGRELTCVVAAVDGTERGFRVYREAATFAAALQVQLRTVMVERAWPGESARLTAENPSARRERLRARIEEDRPTSDLLVAGCPPLNVRHGDPAAEILAELDEHDAGVLVVGYHRGGPAGVVESFSVARHLMHVAPCAVLTIPL